MTSFLFLATLFVITFEKVHWEIAGSVGLADIFALLFVIVFVLGRWLDADPRLPPTAGACGRVRRRVRARLPDRLLQPRHPPGPDAVRQRHGQVRDPLRVPRGGDRVPRAPWARVLLAVAGVAHRRPRRERALRRRAAGRRESRPGPRPVRALAADRRRQLDQHLRRRRGRRRLPAERAHRRSEPPRDHAVDPAAGAHADLPAARARAPLAPAAGDPAAVPARDGARDALAQRAAGAGRWGCSCSRCRTGGSSSRASC